MWSLRTKYSTSDYSAPPPYSPRGSPQRSGSDGWLAKSLSPPQSPRRVGGATSATTGSTTKRAHNQPSAASVCAKTSVAVGEGRELGIAGSASSFVVLGRDTRGEPLTTPGAALRALSFSVSGPARVEKQALEALPDGSVLASWTPRISGRYHLHVLLGGAPLPGSPFKALVVPAAAAGATAAVSSAPRQRLLGPAVLRADDVSLVTPAPPLSAVAGVPQQYPLALPSWAAGGGGVAPSRFECVVARVATDGDAPGGGVAGRVVRDPTRPADDDEVPSLAAAFCLSRAGDYELCVTLDGDHVLGSPAALTVAAADVDPSRCEVHGDAQAASVAGRRAELVVHLADAFGNRRRPPPEAPALTARLELVQPAAGAAARAAAAGTAAPVDALALGDGGSWRVGYAARAAGVYSLELLLGGQRIGRSPYAVQVLPAPLHPRGCVVSGAGVAAAAAGERATLEIVAADGYGNRLHEGGGRLSLLLEPIARDGGDGRAAVGGLVRDFGDGRYGCEYQVDDAGAYRLHLTTPRGEPVGASPYNVVVAPAAAAAAGTALDPPPPPLRAGGAATLRVRASDAYGNAAPLRAAALEVEIVAPPPAAPTDAAPDPTVDVRPLAGGGGKGGGGAELRVRAYRAGVHHLHVRLGGAPVRGSPAAILVRPAAASARHSWVAAAAETRVRPGDRVSVTVVTADAYANPIRAGGGRVAAKVLGACPGSAGVVDHGDGAYTLSFVPRVSGAHALSVMVGGAPVADSPLRFDAGPPPPAGRPASAGTARPPPPKRPLSSTPPASPRRGGAALAGVKPPKWRG